MIQLAKDLDLSKVTVTSPPFGFMSNTGKQNLLLLGGVTWFVTIALIAVLIASIERAHVHKGNAMDSSNLRQIGQAALIYANDNNDRLPEINLGPNGVPEEGESTTVHRYAVALALGAGLNDPSIYVLRSDPHIQPSWGLDGPILERAGGVPHTNPYFFTLPISFQLIGGLDMGMPSTTPIAFTRGLQEDGTWNPSGDIYRGEGGHTVFVGGNVRFDRTATFSSLEGTQTPNILKTLTPDQKVYSYPEVVLPNGISGKSSRE